MEHILEKIQAHPVMDDLSDATCLRLDLSNDNQQLRDLEDFSTDRLSKYIFGTLNANQKKYGVGGYLESRIFYQRSSHFGSELPRTEHLGVDIWCEIPAKIYSPMAATVHSVGNNEGYGNYGGTVILEHELQGKTFFSLYGHLALDCLGLDPGESIGAGDHFANLGSPEENGEWPPHLHFQLMLDTEGMEGDYPGVCTKKDKEKYKRNCPDPNLLLRLKSITR